MTVAAQVRRTPASSGNARDELLSTHLGLVHYVARQMARTLAVKAPLDDLLSAGTMGLIEAIESFDASRGLAFSTFAAPRIRGAILDDLRRQDHVPRSVRRKMRDLAAAYEAVTQATGRAPEEAEIAAHLDIDMETLWRWRTDVERSRVISLDAPVAGHEEGASAIAATSALEDEPASIDDLLTSEQEVGHLRSAILALGEQERIVLTLYYFEELNLKEIATVLDLTESRISQVRTKALHRLRGALAPMRSSSRA